MRPQSPELILPEFPRHTTDFDALPIDPSTWSSFYTKSLVVGYLPLEKQIFFLKDASGGSNGDMYLFDIPTRSWTFGDSRFSDEVLYTNLITDQNGNLLTINGSGALQRWTHTADTTASQTITLREEDFNAPGVIKKVYGITVEYALTGSNQSNKIQYLARGGDSDTGGSFTTLSTTLMATSGTVESITFDLTPIRCEAIQWKINGITDDFELYKWDTEFRTLRYKRV